MASSPQVVPASAEVLPALPSRAPIPGASSGGTRALRAPRRRAQWLYRRRAAFTLVEVTLAIGVAAFSFIAIFGLLPVGNAANQAALEQTAAAGLLSAVVSDLRSTPPKAGATGQFNITIPANPVAAASTGPALYFTTDGRSVAATSADAHFLLTVTFAPNSTYVSNLPSGGVSRAPTLARVKVSWPAGASADHPTGAVENLAVLDRN